MFTYLITDCILFPLFNIRSLKIVISIAVYLNMPMYNLPLVTPRCVSLGFNPCFSLLYQFIFRVMLCVLYFTCILFAFFV